MCTAASLTFHSHWFGRNLDLEGSFGEGVTVCPRGRELRLRMAGTIRPHAMIGMALIQDGVPLWFDAVNECGLGMAGLNFPQNAVYLPPREGMQNVAPFEMISFVLGKCATLAEARELLKTVNAVDLSFSDALPSTPLHWMVADRSGSLVVEPTAEGLKVYENPTSVLTNNPPFPAQLTRLADYAACSAGVPENKFARYALPQYSRGMGAMGLPGDWSSASRFARAAFVAENCVAGEGDGGEASAFFHLLQSVAMPRGCVRLNENVFEETVYSCCCNTDSGDYYYTTYSDPSVHVVSLKDADLDGEELYFSPLSQKFYAQKCKLAVKH